MASLSMNPEYFTWLSELIDGQSIPEVRWCEWFENVMETRTEVCHVRVLDSEGVPCSVSRSTREDDGVICGVIESKMDRIVEGIQVGVHLRVADCTLRYAKEVELRFVEADKRREECIKALKQVKIVFTFASQSILHITGAIAMFGPSLAGLS